MATAKSITMREMSPAISKSFVQAGRRPEGSIGEMRKKAQAGHESCRQGYPVCTGLPHDKIIARPMKNGFAACEPFFTGYAKLLSCCRDAREVVL